MTPQAQTEQWAAVSARWPAVISRLFIASWAIALAAHVRIPVPLGPVPITGQTLAVAVIGILLGPRRAFLAVALYLVQGAAGLPFFAGASSGIGALTGATGGYLIAMPFAGALAGALARPGSGAARVMFASLASSAIIMLCGAVWLGVLVHDFWTAILLGVLPFVPGEILKAACASAILTRRRSAR
jgi:biotin transport system substrate-specific component